VRRANNRDDNSH